MAIRERKDVWKLAAWDNALLWYARAVAQMRTRPLNDPTSWGYLAAMHGYDRSYPVWAAMPGPIAAGDQKRYWSQCQHATWFFLPWHRMYLAFFEQIVAKTVNDLGGPDDWALPFWNYSDPARPDSRRLPQAFTDATLPDGQPNALLEPTRDMQAGDALPTSDVALTALAEKSFVADTHGASSGFGGRMTKFNHSSGRHGQLEQLPHDIVHVDVGGLMGDPTTAGLDPIFWLHHANIDRLWEVWLRADPKHRNPTNANWLDYTFAFHSSDGNKASLTAAQVLDTRTLLHGYTYEGVPPATKAAAAPATGPVHADASAEAPVHAFAVLPKETADMSTPSAPPEMVAATDKPLPVAAGTQTIQIPMAQPASPVHARAMLASTPVAAAPQPVDAFLNFENVTSADHPGPVDVYLNVPDDLPKDQHHEELHAGILPMFGVKQASVATDESAGDGLHYVLKITDLMDKLKAQGNWDPAQLRVTLVPRKPLPPQCKLEVGRISLYLQERQP